MSDECSVIESMTLKIDCSLLDGGLFKASLIQVNKVKMWRAIDETIFFLSHLKLLHKNVYSLLIPTSMMCFYVQTDLLALALKRNVR